MIYDDLLDLSPAVEGIADLDHFLTTYDCVLRCVQPRPRPLASQPILPFSQSRHASRTPHRVRILNTTSTRVLPVIHPSTRTQLHSYVSSTDHVNQSACNLVRLFRASLDSDEYSDDADIY
jgi:hypothetical protein